MSVGPISAPTSGAAVTPAAGASGVSASATPAPAPVSTPAAVAAPVSPAATALSAMLGEAATLQDSLAPLLANLGVAAASPNLPEAARTTITAILATQAPLDGEATGADLRTAAQSSGLFLEASLAAEALTPGQNAATGQDLKALLLRLTTDLQPPGEDPSATARAPPASAAERPQPPVNGGQTAGQAAARPTIDPQTPPDVMARALRQQAEAALARVELSQAASLPKPGEPSRWTFEAPVATPDGRGVAQFEISRDGGNGAEAADGAAPAWRARFSVNAAPGGPVHAALVMSGGRLRVTLMAENDDARAALAAGQDELSRTLAGEDGGDVSVRVLGGAPPPSAPAPGQFVDRQS
jgi:hypothetical protein